MRVYCPFPGCGHMGEVITKVHCRTVHNMEQKELFELYGKPQFVRIDPNKLSKNQQKTNAQVGFYSSYNRNKEGKK